MLVVSVLRCGRCVLLESVSLHTAYSQRIFFTYAVAYFCKRFLVDRYLKYNLRVLTISELGLCLNTSTFFVTRAISDDIFKVRFEINVK
jgi:hypothetical protein